MRRIIIASVLAFVLGVPTAAARPNYIVGTATKQASKPYPEYRVRLRDVQTGTLQVEQALDAQGRFIWNNLPESSYLVELLDPKGRVVCTEGPFDLSAKPYHDIVIDCGRVPAALLLLGAATAAGVSAGVVTTSTASPSR